MAVTMQQIAELVGVSRGTVDRVLNNRGRVDERVAVQIRQVAMELGYLTKTEKRSQSLRSFPAGDPAYRRIGVVTQLSGASFMLSIRKGLEDARNEAKAYRIEVLIRECRDVDEEQQCRALDELLEKGIDALAIMPVESDSVREKMQMIISQGIPVLTFNTDIIGTRRFAFIGMDNRRGGRAAAGLLGVLMRGKGTVIAVTGSFSNSTSLLRIDGFTEELSRSFPEISLTGVTVSMDREEEVATIIGNALRSDPDLGGIMMVSSGQMGIRTALENPEIKKLLSQRREGSRPYIIIYDLTPRNRLLMEQDVVDFVIDQDGYNQGFRAVMTLVGILSGGEMPAQEYLYTDITVRTKYTSPEYSD